MNDPIRFSNDAGTVAAVEAYAKALAEGQWPDRQALLDAHPQVASELNACLDALELVHRFVPDVSDSVQRRTWPPDSARQQTDGEVSRLATFPVWRRWAISACCGRSGEAGWGWCTRPSRST